MLRWLIALALAVSTASAVRIEVDPRPGRSFELVLAGPASGNGGGDFRGAIALDGSSAELPIVGRAERDGTAMKIQAQAAYADVPRDWVDRVRPDTFEYRIRGAVAGSEPISWSGRLSWNAVAVGGDARSVSSFVQLTSFELTALSERRSEGRAVLRVENPFSFPIRVEEARYELSVDRHVIGRGHTTGRVLRSRKASAIELPFSVDHGGFLAAVGSAFVLGRDVGAQLRGSLTVRLASADLRVPLDLAGTLSTSGARSGVFAPPPGSTDLSPRP